MSRERLEFKYRLSLSEYHSVRALLAGVTHADRFSRCGQGGRYVVRSLYLDSPDFRAYREKIEGEITRERHGNEGFGYDPVFSVDGVTLAEMGEEQKNRISHRARAIQALARELGLG